MKKRMLNYLEYMDKVLEKLDGNNGDEGEKLNENSGECIEKIDGIMKNHMTQIGFFMHERLVHLIVTVLFAIGTFMTIFTYLALENMGLLMLTLLLIILLIPYIKHYYLLENGVQKMYVQYDRLLRHINGK